MWKRPEYEIHQSCPTYFIMHSIVRLGHDVIIMHKLSLISQRTYFYAAVPWFTQGWIDSSIGWPTVRDIERLVVRICYWGRSFLVSDSATILNISTLRGPGGPADHFFSSLYTLKFPLKLQDEWKELTRPWTKSTKVLYGPLFKWKL